MLYLQRKMFNIWVQYTKHRPYRTVARDLTRFCRRNGGHFVYTGAEKLGTRLWQEKWNYFQNTWFEAIKRTDSSSFSIPVGICGTARLIDAYSCRSGRSSQRKTGRGLEASSARARNDSLLIFLYISRCSINLSDPLMFPTGPIKVLMDDAGSVSSSARVARWRWRGEQRREAGCGSHSLGVCFQRAPVPDSRLSAPWPTWRTLKTLFNGSLVLGGPTPRSQISHSHMG